MAGLFDMDGMDLNAILGSTGPTMDESTLDRLLRPKPGVMTPPVTAQGLDPMGSTPTPPPGPPTGIPPVQGYGQTAMPPAQGFDASAPAPTSGMLPGGAMPPVQGLDVPNAVAKAAAASG